VIAQVWPLPAFLGALLTAALIWRIRSGDAVPAAMAWWFFKTAAFGLAGAFALHEWAHVMLLKRIATISHIALERRWWRISVVPIGTLTPRQNAGVAVAGPGAAIIVGAIIHVVDPGLSWWFMAHAIFLLPVFGDGRSLVAAIFGRPRAAV
jgi:hypothetical protein